MRILCLNAWGGVLHEALMPWIAGLGADVLCLQEVVHTPGASKEWLEYRDGAHILPQRARMFDELRAALPGHAALFSPAGSGLLWDGDRPVPSHFGLACFVHETIPVIGQTTGFVHGAYSDRDYGAHPRPRNAMALRLWAGGRPWVVAQMHGLRDKAAGKGDTPERAAQAERFAGLIEGLAEPGDATVACGDFNILPDSQTLRRLERLGLRDLVTGGGFAGTRTARYTKPDRFADYLMVNDRVPVRRFDVLRTPEVSDHCPLWLEA